MYVYATKWFMVETQSIGCHICHIPEHDNFSSVYPTHFQGIQRLKNIKGGVKTSSSFVWISISIPGPILKQSGIFGWPFSKKYHTGLLFFLKMTKFSHFYGFCLRNMVFRLTLMAKKYTFTPLFFNNKHFESKNKQYACCSSLINVYTHFH